MKWVKLVFWAILIIVAMILGYIFTSENASPVSLMLLGYSLVELKLGSWILIALFMGGLLGLLLSALPLLWGRHSFAAKDRKIRQLEKEINQLRASSVKG